VADDRHACAGLAVQGGAALTDLRSYTETVREGPLKLYGKEAPYSEIAREIEGVVGVVAHGLVVAEADAIVVVSDSGFQAVEEVGGS
jgi:hypothetical protein